MKKRTNPYELIYTTYNKRKKDSIAAIQPLSRSYFKILEIDSDKKIVWTYDNYRAHHFQILTTNGKQHRGIPLK